MGPVSLSVAIMAVPERSDQAGALWASLGGHAPVHVSMDDEHKGTVWGCLQAVWTALRTPTTHVCVLQDDALPCRDFLEGAVRAIAAKPKAAVSFWNAIDPELTKRLRPRAQHWYRWLDWYGNVAFALPVETARWFATWAEQSWRHDYMMGRAQLHGADLAVLEKWASCDDMLLRAFLEDYGIPMWHTVPALVAHGEPNSTTAGSRIDKVMRPLRETPNFIGRDVSALTIRSWAR